MRGSKATARGKWVARDQSRRGSEIWDIELSMIRRLDCGGLCPLFSVAEQGERVPGGKKLF
jgi:hypothetical protein